MTDLGTPTANPSPGESDLLRTADIDLPAAGPDPAHAHATASATATATSTGTGTASASAAARPRAARFGLLRQRDFRLLWTGESISSLGSSVTGVALPLVAVTVLHASAFAVSALVAAAWLPWLLVGLPAGAWVDRLPGRRIMLAADAVSMAAFLSVPIAAAFGVLTSGQLVAVALGAGTANVFFTTAYRVYLPSLVAKPDLLEANAKLQGSQEAANLAGPGIAGLIAQLASALGGLILDAVSFAVSAVCLTLIKHPEAGREQPRRALRSEILDGLRVVGHDPLMRANALYNCVANLALAGYQSLLVLFLIDEVGLSASATGLLIAATSLGGVLGAMVARPLAARFGSARTVLAGKAWVTPLGLLIPLADHGPGLLLFVVASIAIFAGLVCANVVYSGFLQTYIPVYLRGRVSSSAQVLNYAAIPLGAVLAGTLATVFSVRGALWVMVSLFALSGLILPASPIRRLRDLPADTSPALSTQPARVDVPAQAAS